MITPLSQNCSSAPVAEKIEPPPAPARPAQPVEPPTDTFDAVQLGRLRDFIRMQPEVRPEALARARAMIADPSYPAPEALKCLARLFVANAADS